jgi:4-amino-4-deoxy-L-arabinose transferase-like glycosyltransferase
MTARMLLAVAVVAAALFLPGVGAAPFVDPPEGVHAAIALDMLRSGDWITPRLDGIRYFDKPPLLYWLMAGAFRALGVSPWASRLTSALPAVGVAVVTAWTGLRLGGPRLGLLAGLVVAANLELFLFARLVKPDLLFTLCIAGAFAAFVEAYGAARRGAVAAFALSLGAAGLAKDFLGAAGPLAAVAVVFALTRERQVMERWTPWRVLALIAAVAVPWYAAMEVVNRGFLYYTIVDNHILNIAQQRAFPDEDVPLSELEFLAVTAIGFLPWTLALPGAVWRAVRGPWDTAEGRVWLLLALWATGAIGLFALSPFKLPHYGLVAFPAMALLAARSWADAIEGEPGAPRFRWLALSALVVLVLLAAVAGLAWLGRLPLPGGALAAADVATRNLAARGQDAPFAAGAEIRPILGHAALIFALGAAGLAVAAALGRRAIALGALMAAMLAVLPLTVQGFALFAESRSVRPLADIVALRATPADVLAHEGPLERSASWLLALDRRVAIVDGRQSNLAIGATYPEAADLFWDAARLERAWRGPERVFLLSAVRPERSAVRGLPPASVHELAARGGRWLYSNRP